MWRTLSESLFEVIRLVLRLGIGDGEIRPQFGHTNCLDLPRDPKAVQYRQVHWQERFANVKTWMLIFLENGNVVALTFCQRRESRASWASSDD
jgi:hypothetical protein